MHDGAKRLAQLNGANPNRDSAPIAFTIPGAHNSLRRPCFNIPGRSCRLLLPCTKHISVCLLLNDKQLDKAVMFRLC